jgi:uncharacterized protein
METLALGAPGIYDLAPPPLRALTGVRMDVCAFAGVAPRGPARVRGGAWPAASPGEPAVHRTVARAVESWDEYQRLYGGYEGPGLLPYAVASFFEQGGRRAYVARVVHRYDGPGDAEGAARGAVPGVHPAGLPAEGGLPLRARDEGSWGDALRAHLRFRTRPLLPLRREGAELILERREELPPGAVLAFTRADGSRALREVVGLEEEWDRPGRGVRVRRVALDAPPPAGPLGRVEVVEGEMEVVEAPAAGASARRRERLAGLGLSPAHPRWLARVLHEESELVYPEEAWLDRPLVLPPDLGPCLGGSGQFAGGADRYRDLVPEDFFDWRGWSPAEEEPRDGVHCLAALPDLSLLVVPDLYSPAPLPDPDLDEGGSLAGPEFRECVHLPLARYAARPHDLEGLRLDPRVPADRERILALQRRVVEFAALRHSFVALLDVPPGLNQRQVLEWRGHFDSAFAAAFHPWLLVARADDRRRARVALNPAAVAAGIVARQEWRHGVPHGPANALAAGVVAAAQAVPPSRHDELHPAGVNVYLLERDGVRLTGARTLSRDPAWRQLSVRRIVTLVARTLEQQMPWSVFEPGNPTLRSEIVRLVTSLLRSLHRAGAFAGRGDEDSFFVRCDDALNPRAAMDAGRVTCEIGIAPAEPVEFIVLRLSREGDGTVRLEDRA